METCPLSSVDPQDSVIPMEQQDSVFILLKHCQEMKRLENRSRLLTLCLILGFASLFFITQHVITCGIEKPTFKPTECSGQQTKAGEKQHLMSDNKTRPSAHLTTPKFTGNASLTGYVQWTLDFGSVHMQGFTYNKTYSSLVVPQEGHYFVYVGMSFRNIWEEFHTLHLKVEKYSVSYPLFVEVLVVKDSLPANVKGIQNRRTVYTGQVLSLLQGDLLRVWLDKNNYKLIDFTTERTMYIGAFLL